MIERMAMPVGAWRIDRRGWLVGHWVWWAVAVALCWAVALALVYLLGGTEEFVPVRRRLVTGRRTTDPGFGVIALLIAVAPLLLAEWLTLRARLGDWVNVLREGLLLPAMIVPLGATALSGVVGSLAPSALGSLLGMLLLGALIGSLQLFWLFPRFARVARAEAPGDPQRARTYGALWVAANVVAFLILAIVGGAIARALGWTLAGATINGLLRGALYGLLTGLPLAWLLGALPPGEGAPMRGGAPWRGGR